jgi:hypothetical protein
MQVYYLNTVQLSNCIFLFILSIILFNNTNYKTYVDKILHIFFYITIDYNKKNQIQIRSIYLSAIE